MDVCDVVVAGGGPAGSACAWGLRGAGLDVVVVDKATFPRDKVCAGWITPPVIDELRIDLDEYRRGRTLQPIMGFRVGLVGEERTIRAVYGRPVSYGIRRCEFDEYLLRRSGARLCPGTPVARIRRDGARWVVNEAVSAPMLVGAGGHFCQVARMLNGASGRAPVVSAQEAEFEIDACEPASCAVAADTPEIYFSRDFGGYGWCFRKERHLNVGFGRFDAHALPAARDEFVRFLEATCRIPAGALRPWRGHAYLLAPGRRPVTVGDGVMLVGDAAGLAYPQSGEGIRPAVESGLLAASVIVGAGGTYTRDHLEPFDRRLQERFGEGVLGRLLARAMPARVPGVLVRRLMDSPWFVRRVLLDRWFLHLTDAPMLDSGEAIVSRFAGPEYHPGGPRVSFRD